MTKNKRVLVLGVASVQMDAILELKELGYETFACAMAKDGPGADAADHFEEINILDEDRIIDYIKKNDISAVYSVGSDLAMPVASSVSEKLNLPHFVSENTARICNNKNLMRKELGKDFKGNVKFQILKDENEVPELQYPFIIKPVDSQGQRGVRLIRSYNEYIEGYKNAKKYSRSGLVIIEQYISGPEISVNGYVVDGKVKLLIASDRETWPNYLGLIHKHIVPSAFCDDEVNGNIEEIISEACRKLGITDGPVYAQMKLEGKEPYIIEITPRLDGCHMWKILSYYSGVNLLRLTFRHLMDKDTSELNNEFSEYKDKYVLEFICQKPYTKADYSKYQGKINNSLASCTYYCSGREIRPVNGRYEKIGYFIDKI